MKLTVMLALALLVSCASVPPPHVPDALARFAAPGSYKVSTGDAEWRDAGRNVTVRAHIYYPADSGRHPLIVFSHGLGNSRFGYRYLGEHWASWGFISVHIEHPSTGEALARRGLLAVLHAGFNKRLRRSTVEDVHFLLDRLLSDDVPPFLRDRIDARAIGVAGHSLGAYVALANAGAIAKPSLRDPRIRAAAAMSMSENLEAHSYGRTEVPILHMTGTNDSSILYGTTQRMRRIAFDHIEAAPQMLVTIAGATHSTFSSDERTPSPERTDVIKAMTVLWWRAWLENDEAAKQLLREEVGMNGVEARNITPAARP
jgi:predicted dienelactone hydrolase